MLAFFAMLWVTVFLLNVAPDQAFILSLMTFVLVGLGIMFTNATFRRDQDQE